MEYSNVVGSIYDGEFLQAKDMSYIDPASALDSLLKASEILTDSDDPKGQLEANGEQAFLLANFWLKFVKGLGLTSLAQLINVCIRRDGLLQTIATCADMADSIIKARSIPAGLREFVPGIPEIEGIKLLLQALRLGKRFSPIGADKLEKQALDKFATDNDNLKASHYNDSIYGCTAERRNPPNHAKYGDVEFIYYESGQVAVKGSKLQAEFKQCIEDLFSFSKKGKRGIRKKVKVMINSDSFIWSDRELEEAAIDDAIPSGAALDSCKNSLCKCLAAQLTGGREYGHERCVPPYIRIDTSLKGKSSYKIYPAVVPDFVKQPLKDDTVVVKAVPKTYKSPRIIAPETVRNSIRAYMVERELRRMISISDFKDCIIIDLQDKPQGNNKFANIQHARSAKPLEWACFDFSAASDQIAKDEIVADYPEWLSNSILKAVSKYYTTDSIKANPILRKLRMVSTMGNPLTFRNMEIFIGGLCLLAIRKYNEFRPKGSPKVPETNFSVYGDDVMIDIRVAETFIDICKAFGMTLNLNKSHWEKDDPYREACGREYWNGVDVTSMYWPRKALDPNNSLESYNWFTQEDQSYWASIVSLNNHCVSLVDSKFGEDIQMMDACNFLHAYIKGEFPDAHFTNPRAPWRKDGILLGYDSRVEITRLYTGRDYTLRYKMVSDPRSNEAKPINELLEPEALDNSCFEEVTDWSRINDYLSLSTKEDVSYIKALSLYDDPTVRYSISRIGNIGEVLKDPAHVPGTKYYKCACMAVPEALLEFYASSVLLNRYLAHGPSPLGTTKFESGCTVPRRIDRAVPIVGLVTDLI